MKWSITPPTNIGQNLYKWELRLKGFHAYGHTRSQRSALRKIKRAVRRNAKMRRWLDEWNGVAP